MPDLSNKRVSDDELNWVIDHLTPPAGNSRITSMLALQIASELQQRRAADGDVHRCFICAQPFKAGQMVLSDVNEGLGHRDCFGEHREAYVKDTDTGEPLGADAPIPAGEPYDPADYASPPAQGEPVAVKGQREEFEKDVGPLSVPYYEAARTLIESDAHVYAALRIFDPDYPKGYLPEKAIGLLHTMRKAMVSALDLNPSPPAPSQPVAWRVDHGGGATFWNLEENASLNAATTGGIVTPLFPAPPPSQGESVDDTDGLIQIIEQSETLDGGYALTLELDGQDTAVVVRFHASPPHTEHLFKQGEPVKGPLSVQMGYENKAVAFGWKNYPVGPWQARWRMYSDKDQYEHQVSSAKLACELSERLVLSSASSLAVSDEMVFAAMSKADEMGEPLDAETAKVILTAALSASHE